MMITRHRWLLIGLVVLALAWTKACASPPRAHKPVASRRAVVVPPATR